jgi:4'-phosphopantetheinyl transferase
MPLLTLKPQEIHLYHTLLTMTKAEENDYLLLLSEAELARAKRFHFVKHRQWFIAAHARLRIILSHYTAIKAQHIHFDYNEYHKPQLALWHESRLQFNLAHSHQVAVIAITADYEIGVDIEKIEPREQYDIVQRFCHADEWHAFQRILPSERQAAFYKLWVRKEACIKALAKGFHYGFSNFSLKAQDDLETIALDDKIWYIKCYDIVPGFEVAVASNQVLEQVQIFSYHDLLKYTDSQ